MIISIKKERKNRKKCTSDDLYVRHTADVFMILSNNQTKYMTSVFVNGHYMDSQSKKKAEKKDNRGKKIT